MSAVKEAWLLLRKWRYPISWDVGDFKSFEEGWWAAIAWYRDRGRKGCVQQVEIEYQQYLRRGQVGQ